MGVFTPGSNYAAVFAKYRATLGRKVRLGLGSELAGVWFRGFARRSVLSAVSSTQSLQPAHCTLLHTFAQFRLASLANSSHGFGVWDPRPPPVPMNLQCDLCKKKMTISLRPFNCKLREDTSYNFDVFQEPMSETWDCLLCRLTPQHDLKKIGF